MKVVVAPDKFRGSLTAIQAAQAIARGVARAWPGVTIEIVPMADGGEGTVAAMVAATGGTLREATVTGPLGEPVAAQYGFVGVGHNYAVIEMAAASGLALVPPERRDPRQTTTRGTGELILDAVRQGSRVVILGIGGSATNDGGAGMAQALGYRLLDAGGRDLPPGGGALAQLDRIDASGKLPELAGLEIAVACDVDNPLCGPRGASAVYGPQKGATPEIVAELDGNLDRLARIIERDLGHAVRDLPGAGAGGGLGAGLVAFAGGRLRRGTSIVIDTVQLHHRLHGAHLCLTGEGALDASSAHGKTVVGVGRLARSLGCPTIALAGAVGEGAAVVLEQGIDAYFAIAPRPMPRAEALGKAAQYLEAAAEQAVRAFRAGQLGAGRT